MLQLEVLIGELVTVDGLATGTVVVGEVTTLEPIGGSIQTNQSRFTDLGTWKIHSHELGDDPVETRSGVTEALLTSAKSTEVGSGLWDYVIVELEDDAAGVGT